MPSGWGFCPECLSSGNREAAPASSRPLWNLFLFAFWWANLLCSAVVCLHARLAPSSPAPAALSKRRQRTRGSPRLRFPGFVLVLMTHRSLPRLSCVDFLTNLARPSVPVVECSGSQVHAVALFFHAPRPGRACLSRSSRCPESTPLPHLLHSAG